MKEKTLYPFFRFPKILFECRLKPRELSVITCLMYHANENNICFPSRRLIAEECNMTTKTVDAALKELIRLGLVRKLHRVRDDGSKGSNFYEIKDFLYGEDFNLPNPKFKEK